jgi:hypothetical protein
VTVRYYDRRGVEISHEEYMALLYDGDLDYKRVAETDIETENVWVSTVWLGMDHGYGMDGGDPLIFETMVFATLETDELDMGGIWVDKSASEAEAQATHEHAVAMAYAGRFRDSVEEACRRAKELGDES